MSSQQAIDNIRAQQGITAAIDPNYLADQMQLFYDNLFRSNFVKANDINNVPTGTYTMLNDLNVLALPAADYELTVSGLWTYDVANTSMLLRYTSYVGGVQQSQYVLSKEPSDASDVNDISYTTPFTHPGGDFRVTVEAQKETSSGILNFIVMNSLISNISKLP